MEWFYQTHSVCQLVGSLIYLTMTCPDTPRGSDSSQFVSSPHQLHLPAGHRIIRYLQENIYSGLLFSSGSQAQLRAHEDAGCPDTVAQLLAGVFFLRFLISWKHKKQPKVSKSSIK